MTQSSLTQSPPPPVPGSDASAHGLSRLVAGIRDWLDDRRTLAEQNEFVEDLKRTGALDSLLEALDITQEQFDAAAIPPLLAAELSKRMLERTGTASEIAKDELEALEVQCRACTNWNVCRRWLDRSEHETGYRGFCANAALIDRLRAQR